MITQPERAGLQALLERQLRHNFALEPGEEAVLGPAVDRALRRLEHGFRHIRNKYYRAEDGRVLFDAWHSSQYACFLAYLGQEIGRAGASSLASRVYCLNKMLNGCDFYHEVELPRIFFVEHAVGAVIGRARFDGAFGIFQNCTVGGNRGAYPHFGTDVTLFAQACVIGSCRVGDHVFVSAGTFVKDTDLPSCSVVYGRSPDLVIKPRPASWFARRSVFDLEVPTAVGEREAVQRGGP